MTALVPTGILLSEFFTSYSHLYCFTRIYISLGWVGVISALLSLISLILAATILACDAKFNYHRLEDIDTHHQ